MELRELTLADAVAVTSRMRKADADCLRAISDGVSAEQFAINLWQTEGAAWTVVDGGVPVAVGGLKLPVPWSGVVWFVCTDRMRPVTWKKLIRHGRIVLGNASERLRRVECHVLGNWTEAILFAKRMGFEVEGVRENAGRDGESLLTMIYRGSK